MRQIFSVRFFAAVGAVVGLFFLLTTIFATREVIEGDNGGPPPVEFHKIDFVEEVAASTNPAFALTIDGVAANDTTLTIDASRSLLIVADTPGENHCPRFPADGACAVVADLLGEAVVWFALVPNGTDRTVDLPAIDTLDDGVATLVNGWQFPFAPVLDRRCSGEEFTSYREFRDLLGDDFTSVYGIDDRRLVAVECRTRVDFAPEIVPPDDGPGATVPPPPDDQDPLEPDVELEEGIGAAIVGVTLDEAVERLVGAGWAVRTDDVDDPDDTFTPDVRAGRVMVLHRSGTVVGVAVG